MLAYPWDIPGIMISESLAQLGARIMMSVLVLGTVGVGPDFQMRRCVQRHAIRTVPRCLPSSAIRKGLFSPRAQHELDLKVARPYGAESGTGRLGIHQRNPQGVITSHYMHYIAITCQHISGNYSNYMHVMTM